MSKKTGTKQPAILRRYTNLAATIHLLQEKKITLLNPATWDDKVDVAYMRQCSKWIGRPTLALCFCQGRERYHHWRVFANGMDGVCIEFEKGRLLKILDAKYNWLVHGDVVYRSYDGATKDPPNMMELLFLKRSAYRDEREYRIVQMPDETKYSTVPDYKIELDCVRRVVLSPWMPRRLYMAVSDVLTSIKGCEGLKVARSLLIQNEAWKKFGEEAYVQQEKMEASIPGIRGLW